MGREDAVRLHETLVEQFIVSFPRPPRRLVLDFDATDDPVHIHQYPPQPINQGRGDSEFPLSRIPAAQAPGAR